jgi:predicted PurR-regulated permease PerM
MPQHRDQPDRGNPTAEPTSRARKNDKEGRPHVADRGWGDVQRRNLVARTVGALALIAVLYVGRDVLVPLAVAGVLALVLTPIVNRLERWGLSNGVAVLSVVGVAMSCLFATGVLVSNQAVALLDSLPKYRANIRARVEAIVNTDAGVLSRTADLVGDIRGEIEKEIEEDEAEADEALDEAPAESTVAAPGVAPTPPVSGDLATQVLGRLDKALDGSGPPIAVEVEATHTSALESARAMIGPVLTPLAGAGIVLVFVMFFLLSRRDIKDRLLQLAGRGHLQVTAAAIDEAGVRISKYLLAHLSLNVVYGLSVGLVLWFLDLPGAALWGLLAALLRFIPYVGPWLSALLPAALSLAVFDGWSKPMYVAGTFVALELVSNNVLEPWVYGSKSGLSTVAVLLAALFWGWLWGAVGIVLAVPLTVIVVVLGRYLPQLAPFTILFGDEQSLPEGVRFYHRILAGDDDGATQLVKTLRSSRGVVGLADDLLVPGSAEEKRDRHRGALDPGLSDRYWEFVEDIAANLVPPDQQSALPESAVPESVAPESVAPEPRPLTWCVPISDDAEVLNARLLTLLLRSAGQRADVVDAEALETTGQRPDRVVVLACAPFDLGQLRRTVHAARRIARDSELAVHVAGQTVGTHLAERLQRLGVERVTTRLASLIEAEPDEKGGGVPAEVQGRPSPAVRAPSAEGARVPTPHERVGWSHNQA